ncbi:MAG: hypothetical protein RLO17_24130 [Cyclobacteriaceae bacterium]|jgi:hypothetical protein|tara:strand:+ start:5048 stop:5728 length:681 start_codon:yes stop_codon:yes gene_type:complete
MKKLLFLSTLLLYYSGFAVTLHIDGPTDVCPNENVTYHIYASGIFGKLNGGAGWDVYIDGVLRSEFSSGPYSCGSQSDFYFTPSQIKGGQTVYGFDKVGTVEIRASFKGGIACGLYTNSLFLTSSVPSPGLPTTSDGNYSFCPGESQIVNLLPGMPGTANTVDDCYFHHQWHWTVPTGWTITGSTDSGTGSSRFYSTYTESVKITAPSTVTQGTTGLYTTIVPDSP